MGHSSNFHSADDKQEPHPVSSTPGGELAPGFSSAIEAAIESGCGALLAVEASRASIGSAAHGRGRAEADLEAAIESLRHAIEELRALAPPTQPSQLAQGFVVQPDGPDGAGGRALHS
jgi:hypothetical protein